MRYYCYTVTVVVILTKEVTNEEHYKNSRSIRAEQDCLQDITGTVHGADCYSVHKRKNWFYYQHNDGIRLYYSGVRAY